MSNNNNSVREAAVNAAHTAQRIIRGQRPVSHEIINRLNPDDAGAVAAVLSRLRSSIRGHGANKSYRLHLINAMQTSNFEVARFLFDNATFSPEEDNLPHRYFLEYIRTNEYKSGTRNAFRLAHDLYGISSDGLLEKLVGPSFQRDALNAFLVPHYVRDPVTIFGANAADEHDVENNLLTFLAEKAKAKGWTKSLSILCKWYLTKLVEAGPFIQSFMIYGAVEPVILNAYTLLHGEEQLDDAHQQSILLLLCQAVRTCPPFQARVANSLQQQSNNNNVDVMSICDQVAEAEVMPETAVVVAASEQGLEEEMDAVATPMPPAAVAVRDDVPAWARFSDRAERGERIVRRPSGGTRRSSRQLQRWSDPATARRRAKALFPGSTLRPSTRRAKKYMLLPPGRTTGWVHFGEMGYTDFTRHRDLERRRLYLARSARVRGNWRRNKYSANNLARRILW